MVIRGKERSTFGLTPELESLIVNWNQLICNPIRHSFYKKSKAAQDVEYPAYGITGPNKEKFSPTSGGDRRLAQNAQMYHYQHQKQQIIAMENKMGENGTLSDVNSDDENDEGDYTVYECPGLAPVSTYVPDLWIGFAFNYADHSLRRLARWR